MTADVQMALGNDFLLYNPEFKCVICKICGYAIQPKAISRHLKQGHKIYRKEREDILDLIARVPLVDPAHLQHRELGDPVTHLAILKGLYCTADDCTYLCESLKRMQQHWATSHNRTGNAEGDWQPTLMQTFFRGTCTRYFRVRGSPDLDLIPRHRSPREIAPKQSPTSSSDYPISASPTSQPDVNLSDLSLYHQYINFTSKTMHCSSEPTDFWTTTIPQIALQYSYLMNAVLSTSAMHIACLQPKYNFLAKQKQVQLSSGHLSAGLPGFRQALDYADYKQIPILLGFSKLLLLQKSATLQCVGLQETSCTGTPGCNRWHNIVDNLRFTRSNTAMIYAILRMDALRVVTRFVPLPPNREENNPSLEPMRMLHDDIMRTYAADSTEHFSADCIVLLETWQHFTNVFAIEYHSSSSDRRWESIIYLSSAMSEEFLDLLENHNKHAKMLLAFYSVAIGYLGYNWWLTDHGREVFMEVKRHLDQEDWRFIEWPSSQVEVEWVT